MKMYPVVGAAPTGATPTTSEWSTSLLPTKPHLILEAWWYLGKAKSKIWFKMGIYLSNLWMNSSCLELTTWTIWMSGNYRKYKYIFMWWEINSAWQWLNLKNWTCLYFRFLQTAEMLKPPKPSGSHEGSGTSEESTEYYPHIGNYFRNTVEPLYNTIVFHQNTHKRHSIARP